MPFVKATKIESKLRMALAGPSGSGQDLHGIADSDRDGLGEDRGD